MTLLRRLRFAARAAWGILRRRHAYLSTACWHAQELGRGPDAERLHAYCKSMTGMQGVKRPAQCKFCQARCTCSCHDPDRAPARTD